MCAICFRENAGYVRMYVREYARAFCRYVPSSRGSAEVCLERDLLNKIYGTVPLQISSCGKSISFKIHYLVYLRPSRTSYCPLSAIVTLHAF
jgi:hypothetical protein